MWCLLNLDCLWFENVVGIYFCCFGCCGGVDKCCDGVSYEFCCVCDGGVFGYFGFFSD